MPLAEAVTALGHLQCSVYRATAPVSLLSRNWRRSQCVDEGKARLPRSEGGVTTSRTGSNWETEDRTGGGSGGGELVDELLWWWWRWRCHRVVAAAAGSSSKSDRGSQVF